MSPSEACRLLGVGWAREGRLIVKRVNGVKIASRRIFDGSEHPLAQAGKVVFTQKDVALFRHS